MDDFYKLNKTFFYSLFIFLFLSYPILGQETNQVYHETFSGLTAYPSGWKIIASDKRNPWAVIKGVQSMEQATHGSAMNLLHEISPSNTATINDWAFTPTLDLVPGPIYTIQFYQKNSAAGSATFNLVLNTSQSYTGKDTIFLSKNQVLEPRSNYILHTYNFYVNTAGKYSIGFGITGKIDKIDIWIDEIGISSSTGEKVFYNKLGSDLSSLLNWGMNQDGSGISPISFSYNDQIFKIANYNSNNTMSLPANWGITGTNSKLILGDNINPITLSITENNPLQGTVIEVGDLATLSIDASTYPTIRKLSPKSTLALGPKTPGTISIADSLGSLLLNSGKNTRFSQKTVIQGKLQLQNGKLELGNNDLELTYGANIETSGTNNYVVVNGAGRLRQSLRAGAGEVLFPVGNTHYNPVRMSLDAGSQSDVFSVGLIDGVYETYDNDVPNTSSAITNMVVNKTWLISEDVAGGSYLNLTLSWNAADALLGFVPGFCHIKHYENGAWDAIPSGKAILTGTTWSITRTGITSFSPFSVSSVPSNETPLPISLAHFNAKATNQTVELSWSTAQETNNGYFVVERGSNVENFMEVGRINGGGTTTGLTNYHFTDQAPLTGTSYYRLRQVDMDGAIKYSLIRSVNRGHVAIQNLHVYPNPAQNETVQLNLSGQSSGERATLEITDGFGRPILQQSMEPGVTTYLQTSNLKSGTYLLRVITQSGPQTRKLVVL